MVINITPILALSIEEQKRCEREHCAICRHVKVDSNHSVCPRCLKDVQRLQATKKIREGK